MRLDEHSKEMFTSVQCLPGSLKIDAGICSIKDVLQNSVMIFMMHLHEVSKEMFTELDLLVFNAFLVN